MPPRSPPKRVQTDGGDCLERFRVGLDPEARQALIQERIAKIFEQMSSNTDPPAEARERTRPTRDRGPVGVP